MTARSRKLLMSLCGLVAIFALGLNRDDAATAQSTNDEFGGTIQPFLKQHCTGCHNSDKNAGGVALDIYKNEAHAKKDRKMWEMVKTVVEAGEMPPKKKPQPAKADRDAFLKLVDAKFLKIDCTAPKDPGRVTLRRLNRNEYNATIRDLCGVQMTPADDFPADDVGYGFDNIGDVLSLQPVLLEKYMAAADQVLESALPRLDRVVSTKQNFRPQTLQATPRSSRIREKDPRNGRDITRIEMKEEGSTFIDKFNFPADGDYVVRVRGWGKKVGDEFPKMSIRIDGREVKSFTVDSDRDKRKEYDFTLKQTAGERRVAVALVNPFTDSKSNEARTLGIEVIEIEGPVGGAERPMPESVKKILVERPKDEKNAGSRRAAAVKVVGEFARRAFRRPVSTAEVERLLKLFDLADGKGEPFHVAVQLPLKAILVSPHFLFRIEDDPKPPAMTRPLNDFELATRLSYFLWSSMPDDELYQIAAEGELRKPGVMKVQVVRMLKDWKAQALTSNFASQWLQIRDVWGVMPDSNRFPTWDEELRKAMVREMEMYFQYIVKEDRPITEFLDSNYTFVNQRLAKHYNLPGVSGKDHQKVTLPDGKRGGVLTMGGFLTLTSNPTRTSPVKRGKWVYENILGLQAPPPAPDVPELPPVGEIKGTVRQIFEQHRANPSCAACHAKLDPLGFALENFDGIGQWRNDENKVTIDASGILPDGAKFDGPAELKKVLIGKADQFRRSLCEKVLTYALGRGLEYTDKCTVDEIAARVKGPGKDHFSELILAVVETDAFRNRAGKRSE
jgi:mono/diheme cytochrome c family protein